MKSEMYARSLARMETSISHCRSPLEKYAALREIRLRLESDLAAVEYLDQRIRDEVE